MNNLDPKDSPRPVCSVPEVGPCNVCVIYFFKNILFLWLSSKGKRIYLFPSMRKILRRKAINDTIFLQLVASWKQMNVLLRYNHSGSLESREHLP